MRFAPILLGSLLLMACTAVQATTQPSADDEEAAPSASTSKPKPSTPSTPSGDDAEDTPADPGPRKSITDFPGSKIFKPQSGTPGPGIVMLHGSEGGSEDFIEDVAKAMAAKGFVVVTYCWFGCTGKSPVIERIPLESVIEIGNWLATENGVTGSVGLFGWSRGAELSLLVTSLAGTTPFKAVAVHAPSDTVVSAFDPATQDNPPNYGGILEGNKPAPSWTWKGQDLFGEPKSDFSVPGPKIAVQKYTGPVYVSQGNNDEVWPVSRGKAVVAARNAVSGLVTQSHFFANEGHVLTRQADVDARNSDIGTFFKTHL